MPLVLFTYWCTPLPIHTRWHLITQTLLDVGAAISQLDQNNVFTMQLLFHAALIVCLLGVSFLSRQQHFIPTLVLLWQICGPDNGARLPQRSLGALLVQMFFFIKWQCKIILIPAATWSASKTELELTLRGLVGQWSLIWSSCWVNWLEVGQVYLGKTETKISTAPADVPVPPILIIAFHHSGVV